jgi:hypothetical protein
VPVGVVSRTKDVSHFRSGKVRWCHVKGNSEERTVPFLLKLKTLKCFSITMSLAPQQKPGISEIPGFLVLCLHLSCLGNAIEWVLCRIFGVNLHVIVTQITTPSFTRTVTITHANYNYYWIIYTLTFHCFSIYRQIITHVGSNNVCW